MKKIGLILVLSLLLAGCASKTDEQLQTENKALREKVTKLEAQLESQSRTKDEAKGGVKGGGKEVLLTLEPTNPFEVRIHRILLGKATADAGLIYNTQLIDAERQNKYVVYFDISVKNIGEPKDKKLYALDFKLEDNEGNTYEAEPTHDHIRGSISQNRQGRGGVAFVVYKGNIPKRLIYDTGYRLVSSREKIFAVGDLDKFNEIFR